MSIVINIEHAKKAYGNNVVIKDLSLQVKPGEFFTLLGPSGCGKTTLLRMIAGFNSIEGGTIKFDEKVINDLPPHMRNVGMVFQNYAIFPNMTARENIAFGLKEHKVKEPEVSNSVSLWQERSSSTRMCSYSMNLCQTWMPNCVSRCEASSVTCSRRPASRRYMSPMTRKKL